MKPEDIISFIISLACIALFLGLYSAAVSWAINDAQRRGKTGCFLMVLFWLFGPLSILIWLLIRPPVLARQIPQSYSNPDDALAAASRLDTLGDWDLAISLYEHVATRWPEHAGYSTACVEKIREKQSRV